MEFPSYDSINRGDLEWHNVNINNHHKQRLVLISNKDTYIDCKFGEIEYVQRFQCGLPYVRRESRNNNNLTGTDGIAYYLDIENGQESQSRLMVVRLPYSNNRGNIGNPVNFEDKVLMNNPNCVFVRLDSPSNFKFYIEDIANEVPVNEQQRREVTGRIILNAKKLVSIAPVAYQQNTSPLLEVDFGNKVYVYRLDNIYIFYSHPTNTLIDPRIFHIKYYLNSYRTIIHGEATEGYRLQVIPGGGLGLNPSPENAVFVKICINRQDVYITSTSQIPRTTIVESFRQEIETMGYISTRRNLNIAGADRLMVLESVIADLHNAYIISPYRSGRDMLDWIGNGLQEAHAKVFLKRTSAALSYLHSLSVSHNDLSMENFISADGSNLEAWVQHVCVCDYGQSRLHAFHDDVVQPLPNIDHIGKPEYLPPEINRGPFFGFKVDVFQLGMTVLYALLPRLWNDNSVRVRRGLAPHVKAFHQQTLTEDQIRTVVTAMLNFCRQDLQLSDNFLQLLCKMLVPRPNDRISMVYSIYTNNNNLINNTNIINYRQKFMIINV